MRLTECHCVGVRILLALLSGLLCESALLRMPRLVTSGHCFLGPLWPGSILAERDTSAPTRPIPASPASGSAMGGNGDLPLNCGERMRSGLNCHGGCSAHCGFFHTGLVPLAPASSSIRDVAPFFSWMATSSFYLCGASGALRLTSSCACPITYGNQWGPMGANGGQRGPMGPMGANGS